jgi:hypothetical protein
MDGRHPILVGLLALGWLEIKTVLESKIYLGQVLESKIYLGQAEEIDHATEYNYIIYSALSSL